MAISTSTIAQERSSPAMEKQEISAIISEIDYLVQRLSYIKTLAPNTRLGLSYTQTSQDLTLIRERLNHYLGVVMHQPLLNRSLSETGYLILYNDQESSDK